MLAAFRTWFTSTIPRDQHGQGLAEYALILTFIAIIVIGAVTFFGTTLNGMLSEVGESI
ncbi:MAG: Flp family type IVb pilin [Chloroflexi bacterium]|nr:Flp family type IVb pilin [Chloroflexota bacterium]